MAQVSKFRIRALTWLADFGDHAGRIGRAERDICTPVCRVRLYCLSLWETETTKFLIVRETPRPQFKQKKFLNLIFIYIMKTEILSLVGQALLFIFGVYLEKFIRKHFFSRMRRKQLKQTMRIFTCAIMTGILLFYNFKESCQPSRIGLSQCFFITLDFMQIFHLIVANSLLFGWHIYEKFIKESPSFERCSLKNIFIAPLLEELLFRASFYRTSKDRVSVFILALIFSISHLHKPIRKRIKGKIANWNGALGQVIFTFIFGVYSFYFLSTWFSVIPSVILHCYCNFLGPPSIRNDNFHYHIICIISLISYCYLFVSQ